MNAQRAFSNSTNLSASPVIERWVTERAGGAAQSFPVRIFEFSTRVVHAPTRVGFHPIRDVIAERERDPRRLAAIERARKRIAEHAVGPAGAPTIAVLRLRAGLSQSRVAELIGNSQSSYSLIEAGKRDILLSTFEKLVAVFGVTRDELAIAIQNTQEEDQP